MKILFFSGTGNSLYVAKRLSDDRTSIVQAMKQEEFVFEDNEIGIVCPLYCHMPPKMVQEFLKKASFSAEYLFVIFTYGNRKCDAFEWMHSFLNANGIHCNYVDAVKMVDNFLPSFDMEEQKSMDKDVEGQIEQIIANIKTRYSGYAVAEWTEVQHHQNIMKMAKESPELFDGTLLTVTDSCFGCGICTKVCPNGKYKLINERAVRTEGACDYCQACAQLCPKKAIIPGKTDKNPDARYHNPHVSLRELVEANDIGKS